MPLDQDPTSAACTTYTDWVGYEYKGPGMLVPLGTKPKFKVEMSYSYRKGPIQGMIELIKPGAKTVAFMEIIKPTKAATPADLWDQPYVIIMKLGPHVRYIYPVNTKAYGQASGIWWPFHRVYIPGPLKAPAPDEMQLTALFPDGRSYSDVVTLKYKGEIGSYITRRRAQAAEGRTRYNAALRMPQKTKFQRDDRKSQILSAMHAMILCGTDPRQAKALYDQGVAMGLNKTQYDSLEDALLTGSSSRDQAKLYHSMIEARRSKGTKVRWHQYHTCMQMLVREYNDVAAAREMLGWYLKAGPQLTGAQAKKVYNLAATKGIPLPKAAIGPKPAK